VITKLKEAFDIVLIDSAPLQLVSDAQVLSQFASAVIYVVKAGSTLRKAVEYGVKVQREARDNVLGVLMNDIGEFLPNYYGYKSNYYGYTTEAAEG